MTRREKILESATWLFGYYGFEKTTVDDIAERTGISKGSIYLEFPNKKQFLLLSYSNSHITSCTESPSL